MLKSKIIDCLQKAIGGLDSERKTSLVAERAEVFVSAKEDFGHYSTNIALKLAKSRGENPLAIAAEIKKELLIFCPSIFSKIEVAPPGFINFWLSAEILQKEIKEILKQEKNYGKSHIKNKSRINLEFISANPTGPLHIGHGRGAFLGDVLAKVLKFQGYKVYQEYYINDAKISAQIKELGKTAIGEGKSYLTDNLLSKIKSQKAKIKSIVQKFQGDQNSLYGEAGYLLANEIQKENCKFIEKKLKIKFDQWFSEQSLHQNGALKKLLKNLEQKNLTYKKDGALWLKTASFGDNEDRVLVRTSGEPTYFLSDLAYHWDKLKTRGFEQAIDIWGADHHGYLPRLKAGLTALDIDAKKLTVIITQLVRLLKNGKEARMSKRSGEYVALEDLIAEVGLDATRFFFLMNSADAHMNFDLDLARERSLKNPVYYAQYAGVRIKSVLAKAKSFSNRKTANLKFLNTAEDLNLIRMLGRFPEIAAETAVRREPQILARYALDLAAVFHNFYEKERVINEDKDLMSSRLFLVKVSQIVFQNLFGILGISQPKKM